MSLEHVIEAIVRRVVREELAAIGKPVGGLVTVAEFAAARSISQSTARQAIRDGRLPATRIGRAVRIPADAEIARASGAANEASDRAARRLGIVRGGQK